jgi:hypothetical protein
MPDALLLELPLEDETFVRLEDIPVANRPAAAERPFGLHMETSYILECSVELGAITPLEDLVFRVRNPAAIALMEMTDRDEQLPPHWLRNTARQFLDSLPLEDRYVWALRGIKGLEFGMQAFLGRLEFVVQAKVQSDLGVDERTSIRFMDEADADMFSDKRFLSVHDVTQARVQAFVAAEYGEAKERLAADLRTTQEALEWVSQPGNQARARSIARRLFDELPPRPADPVMGNITPAKLARSCSEGMRRKTQRQARSAIKKALKLFTRTGLEDNVRLMVSGHEVELSHPDSPFKFVLQPLQAGWLEQRTVNPGGHVPYQLTLLTKEGVFLSRLCVLFDQTPVLDQLLALTFFVQSGCEDEILSKANWFGYESAVAVRGILEEKAPALLDKVPAPQKPGSKPGLFGGVDELPRIEAHWTPYKGPVRNWIGTWMGELFAMLPRPEVARLVPV